jgi:hypothetical protein
MEAKLEPSDQQFIAGVVLEIGTGNGVVKRNATSMSTIPLRRKDINMGRG